MKILQVFRYDNLPNSFSMRTFPDSALLKGGKPVFLPYTNHEYRLSAGVALVIGKLGKGFAPRFVDRYVEQVAPVAVFDDITMADALRNNHTCVDMAYGFDGAVNIGSMLPAQILDEDILFRIEALPPARCPAVEYRFAIDEVMAQWRDACSFMAQTMTFKTGDMVIIARQTPWHIAPQRSLTAHRCSQTIDTNNPKHDTILDFNIK